VPKYIIKVAGKYMEYSTIVDAVTTMPMTLEEFTAYYKERYGSESMRYEFGERMARVEDRGTSCAMGEDVRGTLSCNRMRDVPGVSVEDGKEYPDYEMPFEEFEQHVRDLTGPFAGGE
jgi:hypothetical protein